MILTTEEQTVLNRIPKRWKDIALGCLNRGDLEGAAEALRDGSLITVIKGRSVYVNER